MKVAITGSSGLIGSTVARRLREAGHEVIEMRRGEQEDPAVVWNPAAGWIRPGALNRIDAVVNLGGASIGEGRWTDARKRVLRESRIKSTRLLVDHLAEQDIRPAVWVQGSGVDVYGDRGDERLDESASPGDGFLARLVVDWEAEALRMEERGTRVVCARTSFVVDRSAPAFRKLVRPVKFGVGGRLGSGTQWFPWVHLEDEARAIEFLLTSDLAGPVNIAGPETVTNAGLTKILGRVLARPTVFPVPGFVLRLVLGEMARVLLDSKRIVPRALADAGFEWRYATAEAAVREATDRAAAGRTPA